jgi:cytochrome c oxidase subunit 3
MAGDATKTLSNDVLWGGGRSPFSISYGKMMMWFFLVSDALTFSGLLVAYGFVRHSTTEAWPIGEEVFRALPGLTGSYPLIYVALMTAILIFSSVTMVLAVEAGHRMDKKGVIKWMMLTVIGGAFFVGSQAWEWSHFIHGGGGYITTTDGAKYWVHNDAHDTHDPTAHESFHLVPAKEGHYLTLCGRCEHDAERVRTAPVRQLLLLHHRLPRLPRAQRCGHQPHRAHHGHPGGVPPPRPL